MTSPFLHVPAAPAGPVRVRIPADIHRPDRILAGLTARQLTLLAPTLLLVAGVFRLLTPRLPLPVAAVVCVPLAAVGFALALGQHGGLSADRWALAAWKHHRSPHLLLAAPGGTAEQPGWLPTGGGDPDVRTRRRPAVARPLAQAVTDTTGRAGVADLGDDGVAAFAQVDAINITLGSDVERQAKVAAFARMLNALAGGVQVTVRAAPVDLTPHIDRIRARARQLPHPALAASAAEHARFLDTLAAGRTLLTRQILLTAREPASAAGRDREAAATRAVRRLDDAAGLLTAAGLTVRMLDGAAVTGLLAGAAQPGGLTPPAGTTATGTVTSGAHAGIDAGAR